jgi:hypothetical protein
MGLEHLKRKPPAAADRKPAETAVVTVARGAAAAPPPPEVKHVEYRCGHRELIARFQSGDCPPCRAKRGREKAAKERERREKKRADASSQFRFPPGSFFGNVSWDGEAWAGSLSVPQPNGTIRQWHGTGTAVEKVLRALKDAYVAGLAESATA